jgi:SAM-dependent methyltransferase
MSTSTAGQDIGALKSRLKNTWMAGDYDYFSRTMESGAREIFARLNVPPGAHLLDVGCGSGQLALIGARTGVKVVGVDIASNWIERARGRADAEGLDAHFQEADAEMLPFVDGTFDFVVSLVGAMFAPRPELVAAELVRVCRSGGTIAMVNWTPEGFIGQMFKAIAKHIAPPGMPSPVLWGDEMTVRERFGKNVAKLRFARHHYIFDMPFPPSEVVEFFRRHYGPTNRAFASLDPIGQAALRRELEDLWSSHNRAKGNWTHVPGEYLEVVATRA